MNFRIIEMHWFCVLYDPEGKLVCGSFDDTAGAAMAIAWVGAHAPDGTPTPDGTREVMSAAEWDREIAKLKKPK
jgi:hypothetical protein